MEKEREIGIERQIDRERAREIARARARGALSICVCSLVW